MWPFKKKSLVPDAPPGGRIGWLIDQEFIGQGWQVKGQLSRCDFKVQELQRIGNLSRVKVLEVHGVHPFDHDRKKALIDGTFIPTGSIKFEQSDSDVLPEGLQLKLLPGRPVFAQIIDAQDHVWVAFHWPGEGDPETWLPTIMARVMIALEVKS